MMKLRLVPLVLLLLLVTAFPAAALDSRDLQNYNTTPMAVAWRNGDIIYVAVVNEYSNRDTYRLEVYDVQRRSSLAKREVLVPGKSILIESFDVRDFKGARFPIEEITIYRGYYGRAIKIQDSELFNVKDYLVPANTSIAIEVELDSIRGSNKIGRIMVDDDFTLLNERLYGRITVNYEPGIAYYHSNVIEYQPPKLILTMRTPYVRDVDLLNFSIRHRPDGVWRDEVIVGPALIVYSRDYRVLDNTGTYTRTSDSTDLPGDWVVR